MNSSRLLQDMIAPVIKIAAVAGEQILEVYNTEFSVRYKEDSSPLTQADRRAHAVIVQGLSELTPDYPVLSEEDADIIPFTERASWRRYWLVDPLDGTREFVKRNGEFTVNIALIENGRPILGVIQVPVTGKVYSAWQGGGAYCQQDGETLRIWVECPAGSAVRVVCSRSHPSPDLQEFLNRLGDYTTVNVGSSLKVCLIAEGKADLYPRFGPTSEWDTAAADCILAEAGGQITGLDLLPLSYNKPSLLNPPFIASGPILGWHRAIPRQHA